MQCPVHGSTTPSRPAADHDDVIDVVCPECRQTWLDRGEMYELPPRDGDEPRGRREEHVPDA